MKLKGFKFSVEALSNSLAHRYDATYRCAFGLRGGAGVLVADADGRVYANIRRHACIIEWLCSNMTCARASLTYLERRSLRYLREVYARVHPTVHFPAYRHYYRWTVGHPTDAPLPPLEPIVASAEGRS